MTWWVFGRVRDATATTALLAATGDSVSGFDFGVLAQYGVLGVITALLIVFAKGAYQREKDRADRGEAETQRLYQLMLDRIIPALTAAAEAARESSELLQAIQREREIQQIATSMQHPKRRTSDGGS